MRQVTTVCRGFNLFCGVIHAGEIILNPNVGEGLENHAIFLYHGNLNVQTSDGQIIKIETNNFVDLTRFCKKAIYFTTESVASWCTINPTSLDKKYSIEKCENVTMTVFGNEKYKAIICINQNIFCNQKMLSPLQYTRVLSGRSVDLFVPSGAFCVIMTEL